MRALRSVGRVVDGGGLESRPLSQRRAVSRHYYGGHADGMCQESKLNEHDWLATRFEENRAHLRKVAYRMLGSFGEADDAVQEAWIRLSQADAGDIRNLCGWLTTVVSRVCLDMLHARRARREESAAWQSSEPCANRRDDTDPERDPLTATVQRAPDNGTLV